jgi:hypothetical protein
MSFLDNLESSLKNLEEREQRDPREHLHRQEQRKRALAVGPWAEQLRTGVYTQKLFDQAAAAGHRIRTKIYMAWFDDVLRLEAKQRRLELRPTADGVLAAFIEVDGATKTQAVDLNGDPGELLRQWLDGGNQDAVILDRGADELKRQSDISIL